MATMGDRQQRFDRGKNFGAMGLDFIKGAGRSEAFQHLLVHLARIEPPRHIGKIGKWLCAARAHQSGGLRIADALHRGERITDAEFAGRICMSTRKGIAIAIPWSR